MMTWRERIQAARERGPRHWWECWRRVRFTRDDGAAMARCAWKFHIGEALCPAGEFYRDHDDVSYDPEIWRLGDELQIAIQHDDATLAETLLDLIEDRALELKREHRDPSPVGRAPSGAVAGDPLSASGPEGAA